MNQNSLASLTLSLDTNGPPGYQQLVQQIQHAIADNSLKAGQRLPSSRQLASQLGVSRSMVIQAFELLLSEGYLESRPRSGLFVADNGALTLSREPSRPAPRPSVQEPLRLDAGAAIEAFPARAWANSLRRAWLHPDPQLLRGTSSGGYFPLKQALAEMLQQLRGLDCQPEQILITAGSRDGLMLLHHALNQNQHHRRWCLEDPCYPPVRQQLQDYCREYLGQDPEGTQLPQSSGWLALVTPNRQYPLGTRWSSQRRQQWLQACDDNSLIVEDDYDNEFVYQGKVGLPLMQMARTTGNGRVCLLGSLSKMLFRGLRLGYLVVPPELVATLERSQQQLGNAASLTPQPAVAEFITSGELARHLNRMRRLYRQRRDHMHGLLMRDLRETMDWSLPASGMHLLAQWKSSGNSGLRPDYALAEALASQGIRLNLLASHYRDPQQAPAGLIMGFSGSSETVQQQILTAITETLLTRSDP